MKPTFLVVGCGKCGTTTLSYLLAQHPDVFVSNPKEPNFLSYDRVYSQGWEWYESLFTKGVNKIARGEASVSYTLEEYESKVCDRISQYLPEIRVIYIARNPFKRLESVYREHHNSGYQNGWYMPYSLKEAVDYLPQMVTNSLYWQRTEAFRAILPAERILYLCLEDLQANLDVMLRKCFEFIGVDSSIVISPSKDRLNEGSQKMYDTKLMRLIRTQKLANNIYQQLPKQVRELATPILRKPFGEKEIYWEPSLRQEFRKTIANDVQKFLSACDRPTNFWGEEFVIG
jgi:hypothetical protein